MSSDAIRHLPDESLEQYAMGKLPELEVGEFEEHLLICEDCQTRLDDVDVFIKTFRTVAPRYQAETGSIWTKASAWVAAWMPLQRPAFAAALAALALVVVVSKPWGWLPGSQAAPVAVYLAAERGALGGTSAPSGKPLDLVLPVRDVLATERYQVEIVDSQKRQVFASKLSPAGSAFRFTVARGLEAGFHAVRVYSPQSELLVEFALDIR